MTVPQMFAVGITVLWVIALVEWLTFHQPVWRQMSPEDWLVRGGLTVLMFTVVICAVGYLIGVPLDRLALAASISCTVSGGAVVGGFAVLLLKFRDQRGTAALQPTVGSPPQRRAPIMSYPSSSNPITTTSQLTPDGIAGYAKAIAAFVSGLILAVLPFLDIDSDVYRYANIAVAVLGVVAVYAVPNAIKPTPPAPIDPPPAD